MTIFFFLFLLLLLLFLYKTNRFQVALRLFRRRHRRRQHFSVLTTFRRHLWSNELNLLVVNTGRHWFCVVRHGTAKRLNRKDLGRVCNSGKWFSDCNDCFLWAHASCVDEQAQWSICLLTAYWACICTHCRNFWKTFQSLNLVAAGMHKQIWRWSIACFILSLQCGKLI